MKRVRSLHPPLGACRSRNGEQVDDAPVKAYALHDCALYSVLGYGQLKSALKWQGSVYELRNLAMNPSSYATFALEHAGKRREIHRPIRQLSAVQGRIATLLRRIAPPDYRYSGVKGRSFRSNANQHANRHPGIRVDIQKYFQSTTHMYVKTFFRDTMKCAGDVADLLAHICCYAAKCLPIGGRHSEEVAFYCHRKVFDCIDERVRRRGGIMTVYVDDVFVSMPHVSKTDLTWIGNQFRLHGLKIHWRKSRAFPSSEKLVTGAVIRNGELLGTNAMHFRAKLARRRLSSAAIGSAAQVAAARSLLGRLALLAHIDNKQVERYKRAFARLRPLIIAIDESGRARNRKYATR
jgi:RNA-directed DNA polymerase